MSRVSIGFLCTVVFSRRVEFPDLLAHAALRVEFRSIFRAPSRKFKILAIPDVLVH
ncbi:hypothetical protein GW17_00060616, partial [Ensete ventricosum]